MMAPKATPTRASFIMWNICSRPLFGSPTIQPMQSSSSPKLSAVLTVPR